MIPFFESPLSEIFPNLKVLHHLFK